MTDDINNLDTKDEGLAGIFCDRWHDETQQSFVAERKERKSANTNQTTKAAQKPNSKPTKEVMDAEFAPAKPDPDWLDKLKDSVKWIGGFGGLSFLVFYWNEAGLMASSIAIPAMCVCTALAGVGIGKNLVGGNR